MNINKQIKLDIDGLGIIIYSEFAVSHITEGEDYFSNYYQTPEQVTSHINKGTIVGFGTSSPGQFTLKFKEGYPSEKDLNKFNYKIRLALQVKGRKVYFRDLYDLMDWTNKCPESQTIELEDGAYHITLCTNTPKMGIIGDNQLIYAYINKLEEMPEISYDGVPILCE